MTMEQQIISDHKNLQEMNLKEMDQYWDAAKAKE